MSNKHRVYVALYSNRTASLGTSNYSIISASTTVSSSTNLSSSTQPVYQWGIWLEPKNSTGAGASFTLEDYANFSSVRNELDWRLSIKGHKQLPPRMIGLIMIGKMPEGNTERDMARILRTVALPSDMGSFVVDSESWTRAAIEDLQAAGVADKFSVDKFMSDATARAKKWQSKGVALVEKVNYTWGRTFP